MAPKKIYVLLFFFLTTVSCVENIDFSQVEDYSASQSFSFSIAHFIANSTSFIPVPGALDVTEVTQETGFRIFENSLIKENLTSVDFKFEINNSFNRDFTIEIFLLDFNGFVIHRLNDLKIKANTNNIPPVESIAVSDISNIKNISSVAITIKLDNTLSPINSTDKGSISFRSAATIHLQTLN